MAGQRALRATGYSLVALGFLLNTTVLSILAKGGGPFGIQNTWSIHLIQGLLVLFGVVTLLSARNAGLARVVVRFLLFLVFWLVLEGVCLMVSAFQDRVVETGTAEIFQKDELQGFRLKPSVQVRALRIASGDTSFNAVYTIDSLGRRRTPCPSHGSRGTLAFLGCSFTFGVGLNDGQALPALVSAWDTSLRVVDYAVPGFGPQNILEQFRSGELLRSLPQGPVTFIYPMIDGHVQRAIGSMRVYGRWGENMPYFREENGTLVRHGTFTTGRPVLSLIYWMVFKSPAVRFFNLELPVTVRERDLRLTARIVEESARIAREQFPGARFIVVLYPGMRAAAYFREQLPEGGIEVCDLSPLFDLHDPGWAIPGDMHPSVRAQERVAYEIHRWMRERPLEEQH